MDFLIKNTKGLTLKTKGKYCTEDLVIEIDPSLVEGYMEVDELPEVGLPRVLYKLMLEEPEYYIWENDEWVLLNTKGGGGSATVTRELTGGEPIPNTGTLSEIYLNTDLTVEEVVDVLSQLTYQDDGFNYVAIANDMSFQFGVATMDGIYMVGEMNSNSIYFINQDALGMGFTGWNTSLIVDKKITLPSEITLTSELGGKPVGSENYLLKNIVAISNFNTGVENVNLSGNYDGTEFEIASRKTDFKALIENQKIPLSLKVASNFVEPNGTLTITENGTHDVGKYANVEVNVPQDTELVKFLMPNSEEETIDFEKPYINDLREGAFAYTKYNSITLPNLGFISNKGAFKNCQAKSINVDKLTYLPGETFKDCFNLTKLVFPAVEGVSMDGFQFQGCYKLEVIDFYKLKDLNDLAFYSSLSKIRAVVIRTNEVCRLGGYQYISSIGGYIYVPDDLVDSYKEHYYWSKISNKIKPLSEYVEE